ncbi:uncharacterized protein NPIL_467211 [Nephila pilipes]|uniref:Uncharacterized protein n=1 Tax=Nephila pilipes TaxID=299642 RepID=A0A8X6MFE0_NEPPI|nr:uncharacterized protein NPIL_467211 [Nephila pilipes]
MTRLKAFPLPTETVIHALFGGDETKPKNHESICNRGADIIGKLLSGNTVVLVCGLKAVETKLGWTVFGKGSCRIDNILPSLSMHSVSLPENKLWELEVLEISSENEKDNFNLKNFNDKIKILPDRRYEVEFSWKLDSSNLPSNKCLARKRHEKMINRYRNGEFLSDYQKGY